MNRPTNILLIEDNEADVFLITEALAVVKGVVFSIESAERLSSGLERLAAGDIDVVLLDLSLPDSDGFDTFAKTHARAPQVPIVVLSGAGSEALAMRTVREGAQDYLVKGEVNGHLIARAIRYAIARKRTEEALRERTHALDERIKKLSCLYTISDLLEKREDIPWERILEEIVNLLPSAWQYPTFACARVVAEGQEFSTENFSETPWKQSSAVVVQGERIGVVEVCYLEERPAGDEGPFLEEEQNLLNTVAERLGEIIERKRAQEALQQRNRELVALNRAGHAISALLDLDQVLTTILEEVRRIMGVVATSIWLVDEETGELVCRQATGSHAEMVRGWRLAPGGYHLHLDGHRKVMLVQGPRRNGVCPSVDFVMESAAAHYGSTVIGVVLTGMGHDGVEGARCVKAAGGKVIAEHQSTSVVYGMPRGVIEAGLADRVVPVSKVASTILELIA